MFRLDLWEPYGLLLLRRASVTSLRWMAFLSILGDILSFSIPLIFPSVTFVTFLHKSLLQTSLLRNINLMLSWMVLRGVYTSYCSPSDKCLCSMRSGIIKLRRLYSNICSNLRLDIGIKVLHLLADSPLSARKPCVWFPFSSTVNEPCLFPACSCVTIAVRGGWGRRILGSEKDIPIIPLSVWHSKEVCSSVFRRGRGWKDQD